MSVARVVCVACMLPACGDVLDPPRRPHVPADAGVDAGRDAGEDAAPPDAGTDAGCALARVSGEAIADTILASGVPDLAFGGGEVANVGVGVNSVGLFRFGLAGLPAGADVRAARAIFSYVATSSACSPSCGSCDAIESPGDLTLFYARNDWDEDHATWNQRATGATWATAGAAQAGVDRSETPIATVRHVARSGETFEIDTDDLADLDGRWRQGDEISLEMLPSAGAVFVIATTENATEGCTPGGYGTARIEVDYCP